MPMKLKQMTCLKTCKMRPMMKKTTEYFCSSNLTLKFMNGNTTHQPKFSVLAFAKRELKEKKREKGKEKRERERE